MTTKLQDASLKIQLDPESATQELDKLKEEIEKIRKSKDKAREEVQETKREGEKLAEEVKRGAERQGTAQGRFAQSAREYVDVITAPLKSGLALTSRGAAIVETALPQVSAAIRAASGGLGGVFEPLGKKVDEQVQLLSDEVTALRAKLDSLSPTLEKVIQHNIAALRLGGKFPEDQAELSKQVFLIESTLTTFQRNIDKDIKAETIGLIINAARQAIGQ